MIIDPDPIVAMIDPEHSGVVLTWELLAGATLTAQLEGEVPHEHEVVGLQISTIAIEDAMHATPDPAVAKSKTFLLLPQHAVELARDLLTAVLTDSPEIESQEQ